MSTLCLAGRPSVDPSGQGGWQAGAGTAVEDKGRVVPVNSWMALLEPGEAEDDVEQTNVALEKVDRLDVQVERVAAKAKFDAYKVGDGAERLASNVGNGNGQREGGMAEARGVEEGGRGKDAKCAAVYETARFGRDGGLDDGCRNKEVVEGKERQGGHRGRGR